MLAEEIDFYQLFKIHPTGMLLLTADLKIVDVNDEFLEQSGRELEELVGHNLFEEFPKVPDDGYPVWTALEAAMTSGRREQNLLFRYDIEDPGHPGAFVEHYWSSIAQPIHGVDGQVDMIEFSLRDVTPVITLYRALQSGQQQGA